MKIYDFPMGARGLRSIWLCEELGIDYDFGPVSFPPDDTYRAIAPMGRVPHLVDGDVSIGESIALMLFIAHRHGPTPLLPEDPGALARTLEMTLFGEASLAGPIAVLMMVKYGAPAGEDGGWAAGATRSRLKRSMDYLEDVVGDRRHLVGEALTLADISVATALAMWRGGLQETLSSRLSSYLDALQARPAYQAAAARSAGSAS